MTTNDEEIIKKYNLLFGAASEIDLENALDEARAEGYKEGQKAECQKWIDALKGLQTYHAEVYSEAGMGGIAKSRIQYSMRMEFTFMLKCNQF